MFNCESEGTVGGCVLPLPAALCQAQTLDAGADEAVPQRSLLSPRCSYALRRPVHEPRAGPPALDREVEPAEGRGRAISRPRLAK